MAYCKKTMNKIKNLIADIGLNEYAAWLWMTLAAASTAAVLVLVTGGGAEVFRYWRVFFL
jgi:hypothetical protein